ncbi:MAG: undecaprenyl-phosphate glucose phosphotransferase [Alphaproteobacteria bacterium]
MIETTNTVDTKLAGAAETPRRDAPVVNVSGRGHIRALSHRRLMRELIWVFDALVCLGTALATTFIYHFFVYQHSGYPIDSAIWGVISALLFVILGAGQGLYKPGGLFALGEQIRNIIHVWVLITLFLLAALFVSKSTDAFSRGAGLLFLVLTPTLLVISRIAANRIALTLTRTGGPLNMRVALVGSRSQTEEFVRYSEVGSIGLSVMGTYDDQSGEDPLGDGIGSTSCESDGGSLSSARGNLSVAHGSLDDLKRAAQETRIDQIVISIPWNESDRIEAAVDELGHIPVPISLSPDPSVFRFSGRPIKILGGVPYFDIRPRRIDGMPGLAKIAMDKVLSAILLLGLSPLFLVVAILIKATSPGPVFFRQRRHGFNHNVFPIMKFRTMTTTDDGAVVRQATKDDKRVTAVGAFLRRTSIDELPQLLNVLQGEMSLVGPRPHALAHNMEYAKLVARYARRHNVKPGITGWAQVNGYRGETDTLEKMDGRVAHDLWYIEHWSLWLDIKILFMTAIKVFFQKTAY